MPAQRKTGFVERPDAEIYYECTGTGPAIVFAHGLGGNHLSWWQQVPHFRERHTCIVFAHRGFTPSKERPGGAGAEAYADDLAALLDHLGIERASLVCQSMGGWTGIDFALRRPERVSALVLASTSGRVDFTTVEGPELAAIKAWQAQTANARDLLLAEGVHPALGARGAREQPAAHFLYQQIDALTPPAHKERIRKQIFTLRNLPASTLRKLAMPVLYIVGEEDVVFPAVAAAALARLTPGARVEPVPQAGHSVYFERPQRFNALVEAFLRR
ncbi:MAG TPA: alpha/beta hydrolase [Stellaceae bacterium]|nr:alpha/beta hydrolase [Stellaceae bacterium]